MKTEKLKLFKTNLYNNGRGWSTEEMIGDYAICWNDEENRWDVVKDYNGEWIGSFEGKVLDEDDELNELLEEYEEIEVENAEKLILH